MVADREEEFSRGTLG